MPLPPISSNKPATIRGIPVHQNRFAVLETADDDEPLYAASVADRKAAPVDHSGPHEGARYSPTFNQSISVDVSGYARATSFFLEEDQFPSDLPRETIEQLREIEVIFDRSRVRSGEPWRYEGSTPGTESGSYQSPLIAADEFGRQLVPRLEFSPIHVGEIGNVTGREPWTCSQEVGLCLLGPVRGLSAQVDASRLSVVQKFDTMFEPVSGDLSPGEAMALGLGLGVFLTTTLGVLWCAFGSRDDDNAQGAGQAGPVAGGLPGMPIVNAEGLFAQYDYGDENPQAEGIPHNGMGQVVQLHLPPHGAPGQAQVSVQNRNGPASAQAQPAVIELAPLPGLPEQQGGEPDVPLVENPYQDPVSVVSSVVNSVVSRSSISIVDDQFP